MGKQSNMRTKPIFLYVTAIAVTLFGIGTLADSVQMQCPEVRDYGGFPHTTGSFVEYKVDYGRETLSRRYGDKWTVVCDRVSKCTFSKDMVSVSEILMDQKKIIDRQLDFINRTEKAKEWSDIRKTRLIFGYESTCR